jgi:DNA-binding transcriptional LysR family regulator
VLWEIRGKHPMVRPKILYRNSDELLEALLGNKLDVAMVADPHPDRRLRYETVLEEHISLVSSPSHPFFGRPSVEPAELKGVQFVSLSPQTPTGALIQNYLDKLGVQFEPVVSTDNVETVKRMVEAGMGVAFLPDMVTSAEIACDGQPGRLSRSAVEPPLTRRVVLATWRDSHHSRAAEAFIGEVRRTGRQWRGCRG